MKVLYIYSGLRKNKFKGVMGRDYPDTPFYGLNHLAKFGIEAEYKEFGGLGLGKFLPFSVRHALMTLYYSLTRKYDVIFGSSILYGLIFKKIFGLKQKFVLLDISLGRTLSANSKNKVKLSFIKWLLKSLDAVVCLSNIQKENLEKKCAFLIGKIFYVPLGVDTVYNLPKFAGRQNYILSIGRDNGRDYKTVFEVARLMPERKFVVICSPRNIVGLGEAPSNITIYFDLSLREVHDKLDEAGVLLLTTHDDNYLDGADCSGQTVLLDAMAHGTPIIVSHKKYLSDYVRFGEEAVDVNFYDAKDVADKIGQLDNKNFAEKITRNARRKVESEFSTENMAEGLSRVFKKVQNI